MDPLTISAFPVLIWAIFGGATALTIILGLLLAYHWFRYAMSPGTALLATLVYGATAVFLLSILLSATLAMHTL